MDALTYTHTHTHTHLAKVTTDHISPLMCVFNEKAAIVPHAHMTKVHIITYESLTSQQSVQYIYYDAFSGVC